MKLIIKLTANIIALYVVDYIIPGFSIADFTSAFVAAVILGVINTFIKPIIQILALPFSIVTLGLFAFLINVGLLYLASLIVPGFEIDGFWTAVMASASLSLISWFFNTLLKD